MKIISEASGLKHLFTFPSSTCYIATLLRVPLLKKLRDHTVLRTPPCLISYAIITINTVFPVKYVRIKTSRCRHSSIFPASKISHTRVSKSERIIDQSRTKVSRIGTEQKIIFSIRAFRHLQMSVIYHLKKLHWFLVKSTLEVCSSIQSKW